MDIDIWGVLSVTVCLNAILSLYAAREVVKAIRKRRG